MEVTTWQVGAACAGCEPSLFFPDTDDDPAHEAKAICRSCEVREECLDHALGRREKAGVWGGTTERERRRILRRRRRVA